MSSFNVNFNPEQVMSEVSDPESAILNKCLDMFNYAASFRNHFEPRWKKNLDAYFGWDDEIKAKSPKLNRTVVPRPYLLVETKLPRVMKQLFSKENLYTVLPGSKDDVAKAKLWSEALAYQVRTHDNFIMEHYSWFKDSFILGTGIAKTGWTTCYEMKTRRMEPRAIMDPITGQVSVENKTSKEWSLTQDRPIMRSIDIGGFYPDPHATTIENARYMVHRELTTRDELKRGQAVGLYKDVDKISNGSGYITSDFMDKRYSSQKRDGGNPLYGNDPIYDLVEILECWYIDEMGSKRKTMIANRQVVIQDIPAPYWHNRFPFYVIKDIPINNEFWGWGEVDPVYDLWKDLSNIRTIKADNRDKFAKGYWVIDRTKNVDIEQFENLPPGGMIEVTGDPSTAIFVHRPDQMDASTIESERQLDADIQITSGANDIAIGGSTRSQIRTATTGSLLQQSVDTRFGMTALLYVEQVKKIGRDWLAMSQQFLTQPILVKIANDSGILGWEQASPFNIPKEYDVYVASGSELSGDKDVIRQQKLQMFSMLGRIPGFKVTDYAKELMSDFGEKAPERFFEGQYTIPDQAILQQLGINNTGSPLNSSYMEQLGGLIGGGTQEPTQAQGLPDLLEMNVPYGQ